jgi:hypothetical protein
VIWNRPKGEEELTMSKKTVWIMNGILALGIVLVAYAIFHHGADTRPFGTPTWKGDLEPGSSYAGFAEHQVRRAASAGGHSVAYVVYLALIAIVPWITIILIPGALAGDWEMKAESSLILFASLLLWFGSDTFRDLGLGWWLLILDIIPAAIMIFWTSESGKVLLFGVPAALLGVHTIINIIIWVADGLILKPLATVALLAAIGFAAHLCHGKLTAAS